MRTINKLWKYGLAAVAALLMMIPPAQAAAKGGDDSVPVTTTVTASVSNGKRLPALRAEDIVVKQGKDKLRVVGWVPAQGQRAGLDLFIPIDDASDPRLGAQLADLRQFILSQPASTSVGVGYMRNTTVQIAQDFTRDHNRAANALRMPIGSPGAFSSPYLSAIDLVKRWPESGNRREVVMITDGIDRARNQWHWRRGLHTNPDVDTASRIAQRSGTVIHTLYHPGVGPWRHNYWQATSGQADMARLSSKTGGQSFNLGLQTPVSFTPHLNDLQKSLDNQYLLSFAATPGNKPALQTLRLDTEVAGVNLATQEAVWVPGARQ